MASFHKRWQVASPAPTDHFSRFPDLHPLMVQILYNRGITEPDGASAFFDGEEDSADPFALPDMDRAVERIIRALEGGEKIAVFGDFDADGVTATALLVQALEALGGRVRPYIPDRVEEGYGLNVGALRSLAAEGVSLVVTVDCGVRAWEEIAAAKRVGLDVVITDHHEPRERVPDAVAIIDPKWSRTGGTRGPAERCEELAGVGVAYRLAQALLQTHKCTAVDGCAPLREEDLLDLVALGTVADLVPLRGQNRTLVRAGLKRLNAMERPGIRALCRQVGLRPGGINARTIGFVLGPRVNAAGRLSDVQTAYRLLNTSDPVEAQGLAVALDGLNRERQRLTQEAHERALELVRDAAGGGLMLFAASTEFSLGVVGLVASRLLDAFYRPAIVVSVGREISRGSCRSVDGFDITGALDQCRDLLIRHGGHAAAAGFRVDNRNLDALEGRLRAIAEESLGARELQPVLEADAEPPLSEMTWELLADMERLEPYGCGNEPPLFVSRGVFIRDGRAVGRDRKHLKLTLSDGRATWDAIAFRQGSWATQLPSVVDIAYHLELNEWRGRKSLQLNVRDLRPGSVHG